MPNPGDPQSLNRYSYVLNNPLRYTDPTGHAYDAGGAAGPSCSDGSASFMACTYPVGHSLAGYWIGMTGDEIEANQAKAIAGVSIGVDFTPIVGDVKGVAEVFTGSDLMTGENLGAWRLFGLLGLSEVRHLRHADEVVEGASNAIRKRIVIGEGMDAIKAAAHQHDAKWYQAWSKNFLKENFDLDQSLARNERWVRSKISEGYEILDIGIDPSRPRRSLFYQLERRILGELGYPTIPIERPF